MKINNDKEKALRYLFNELSESERDYFEERIFGDEDPALFMDDVEKDLVDEYVRGELEFDEKRRFEKEYLISDLRQNRVDMARILSNKVFTPEPLAVESKEDHSSIWKSVFGVFGRSNPLITGGLAALVLLILLGGLMFVNRQDRSPNVVTLNNSNENEITPIGVETPVSEIPVQPEKNPDASDQSNDNSSSSSNRPDVSDKPNISESPKKPTPEPAAKEQGVFAFSLLSPLRSGTTPVLSIPPETKTVRLRLIDNFGGQYKKFNIDLADSDGNTVWNQEIGNVQGKNKGSITLSIPNNKFNVGNYEIAVRGITDNGSVEEVNFYNFTVVKK